MSEHDQSFWEKASTIRLLTLALYVGCALAVVGAGLAYFEVIDHPHPHFHWVKLPGGLEFNEFFPGFFAAVGFFAYMTIVNSAKLLRTLVMREEDYYGE